MQNIKYPSLTPFYSKQNFTQFLDIVLKEDEVLLFYLNQLNREPDLFFFKFMTKLIVLQNERTLNISFASALTSITVHKDLDLIV